MRLMKLRELNDENKSKSHGNVTRSTSAYGDNKYVPVSNQRPASPGNNFTEPTEFFVYRLC